MNNTEIREIIRQILTDWNNMTDEQQAAALAAVARWSATAGILRDDDKDATTPTGADQRRGASI